MSRFDLFVVSWVLVVVLVVGYVVMGGITDIVQRLLQRRQERVLGVIGVVLFDSDAAAEEVYEQVRGLPRRILLDVLAGLAVDLDGSAQDRVRRLVRSSGLERFVRRRSRSRRWRLRVQAAQLHHLVDHPDLDRDRLLRDRHPIVRARAAEVLTAPQAAAALDTLFPMLAADHALVRMAAQRAVLTAGSAAVPRLLAVLSDPDADPIPALEVVSNLSDQRLIDVLGAHAESDSARVRELVSKALGAGSGTQAIGLLHRLVGDVDPVVRATAIESIARLDAVASAPRVGRSLSDPAFAVRRAAGMALDRMGSSGRLALRAALESDDRFARDMARQVLDSVSARLGVSLVPASTDAAVPADATDLYAVASGARLPDLANLQPDRIRSIVRFEANRALGDLHGTAEDGPLTHGEVLAAAFVAISAADVIDALLGEPCSTVAETGNLR